MRNIFVISLLILLGIVGCTEYSRHISSSESIGCQMLRVLFSNLEKEKIQTVAFFGEDSNEPIDEATLQEFKESILVLAGCCFSKPHPLSNDWMEHNRLDCIWENLERENIQKIAFYGGHGDLLDSDSEPPENWRPWVEIINPQKIKEIIKLLIKAMKEEKDRRVNGDIIMQGTERMQIITDKHKFIIAVCDYEGAIRGIGWTSYELKKKLTEWGFPRPK